MIPNYCLVVEASVSSDFKIVRAITTNLSLSKPVMAIYKLQNHAIATLHLFL